jgi:hypothetical protein
VILVEQASACLLLNFVGSAQKPDRLKPVLLYIPS